ncbi:MAG: response regulator [Deltaproteobacteria bacterium]|nr:response regulator [Deltaproteobacteria bacterium]
MNGLMDGGALSGRTLLMVDDETVVIDVVKEVVGPAVGAFDTAADGVEALLKIMDADYDFILLDVKMPKMDGIEFYNHVKTMKPYLLTRVIFITGDTETERTRNFIRDTGCPSIDKPFLIKELLDLMTCRV